MHAHVHTRVCNLKDIFFWYLKDLSSAEAGTGGTPRAHRRAPEAISTRMCTRMSTHSSAHMRIHMSTHTSAHTYTNERAHIYTHVYVYTHA